MMYLDTRLCLQGKNIWKTLIFGVYLYDIFFPLESLLPWGHELTLDKALLKNIFGDGSHVTVKSP